MDELQASFDRWEASFDALCRYLLDTGAGVTEPVTANSDRSEVILAPAGMPDPLVPVPAIEEPPAIARAAPIDSIDVVPAPVTVSTTTTPADTAGCIVGPVQLSSDSTDLVSVPVGLAEPPVRILIMEESLVVAPAVPNATSTVAPTCCSTEDLSALVPAKCLTECIDMGVLDMTRRYEFVSDEADKNGANNNCDDLGEDHRPSWPPPLLVLAYLISELQHDKVQWQPWPPPLSIYLQSTQVVDAAMSQKSGVTCVLGTIDKEEQFTYLCANLNVSNFFLKKPFAEWEEAIWSSMISRTTHALRLWCISGQHVSYDQLSCAIHNAPHWPDYFVNGVHLHVCVAYSVGRLLLIDSGTFVPFLKLFSNCPNSENSASTWLMTDFIDELSNSENTADHHYSVLTSSHITVLISMVEHQLSTLLFNCHSCSLGYYCQSTIFEGLLLANMATDCGHLNSWSSTRLKPARQLHQMKLRLEGAQVHELFMQHVNSWSLFLQPKPPWVSTLKKVNNYVEEGGVRPHWEVMTLNSKTNLLALGSHVRQQIGSYLLWTSYQAEWYTSCNWLLPACKPPETTCVFRMNRHSWLCSVILVVQVTLSQFSVDSFTDLPSKETGFHSDPVSSTDSLWLQRRVQLNYQEQFIGLESLCKLCVQIFTGPSSTICLLVGVSASVLKLWHIPWLVAWDVDNLQFFTGCGQDPSQGGRKATDLGAFSDQVFKKDYYIAFVNQIHVGYDFYLNQGYDVDTVCSTIIGYHEDFHGDSSKTKEGHMPWDPGRSVPRYDLKFRLGDKPSFKEGGMLGPSPAGPFIGLTWARNGGLGPTHSQLQIDAYNYPMRRKEQGIQWITARNGGGFLSHLGSDLPSPSCLFFCLASKFMYQWLIECI